MIKKINITNIALPASNQTNTTIFWFRRDLRLEDNIGLTAALKANQPVLPIFIFDSDILQELPKDDARVSYIYQQLEELNKKLKKRNSGLAVFHGTPEEIFNELGNSLDIHSVYTNKDYEPYAIKRDSIIKELLNKKNIEFHTFKDQVIFEENEILKNDGKPYTVFTHYKNKWRAKYELLNKEQETPKDNFLKFESSFPSIEEIGFQISNIVVQPFVLIDLEDYEEIRNFPGMDKTTYVSPHLRFGTISVRKLAQIASNKSDCYLNELAWREFFMQILYHFPHVVNSNFKPKYNGIEWRNNEEEFDKWSKGETGYPIVDAGMRQLNETGYMHNRVRMVVASFLCKHLLIDWKWGEAYFAVKLLDYELSSNNGNWQWSSGTGCDSAPYFRIFNPYEQTKRFDKGLEYIRRWVPEYDTLEYAFPMVEHKFARERALKTYKIGLENYA